MKTRVIRFVFSLILSIPLWTNHSFAQKTYFVYLQSEQQQPFYVIHNNKNLSSSAAGYLILPKLTDGTYQIKIGFPKSGAVQDYDLQVHGNDAGYLVKNFGEKGWGITDLQSGLVQMSGTELKKRENLAAASREADQKKINDSLQLVRAAEARQRVADSLVALEKQRVADSIQTASTVAANLESKTEPVVSETSPPAGSTTSTPVESKPTPVETKATPAPQEAKPVVKSAPAASIPVVVPVPVPADPAASTSFKSEAAENETDSSQVPASPAPTVAKQTPPDVTPVPVEPKKVDSVPLTAAEIEAQRKIDEAREVMNRVLNKTPGTPATTAGKTGSAVVPVPVTEKKEAIPVTAATPAKASDIPLDSEFIGDTIEVKIPAKKSQSAGVPVTKSPASPPPATKPVTGTPAKTPGTSGPAFLDMEMGNEFPVNDPKAANANAQKANDVAASKNAANKKNGLTSNNANTKIVEMPVPVDPVPASPATTQKKEVDPRCPEEASDKDFFALRKKMAADSDPEDMLSTARKAFKDKCYTSFQVKNLCVLFLTDENKYRFLDMAYRHTSDIQNFKPLGELLTDEYYINRFKAMVRE